jgi:hypothetical protein
MAKEFKLLRGNRIYLEMPPEKNYGIVLDEETKALVEKDKMREWGKLKVYAVGELIQDIKEGDLVMIDPNSVSRVVKIELSPKRTVLLVSTFDIAHIW